jgi:uncharacterized protein (TIGR02246 family)
MADGVALTDLHPAFEAGYNDGDLDAVMALYAPDVTVAAEDGSVVTGRDAVRRQLEVLFSMHGRMAVRTRYVLEAGDLALLGCEWTLTVGHESLASTTAEVAQRQPGGGWLWILDHPFASLRPAGAGAVATTADA